jgi:hypothetical protein
MQGNCAAPFPTAREWHVDAFEPPLLPQKPGQCLLLLDTSEVHPGRGAYHELFIHDDGLDPLLLLEGLYLRSRGEPPLLDCLYAGHDTWLSNVTLQGSRSAGPAAVGTQAQLHAEGAPATM